MRILWLYRYAKNYSFDNWFHLHLVEQMIEQGINIKCYGPAMQEYNSKILTSEYHNNITLAGIHKVYPFDVVICNTKSRMFAYHSPHKSERCWLPKDFATFNTKRVMIEEDYHYETEDSFYKQFDLTLQRHYNSYIVQKQRGVVNTKWFPFSIDEKTFYPEGLVQPTIGYSGHSDTGVYPFRTIAKSFLANKGLLTDYDSSKKGVDYIHTLRRHIAFLSGSSIYYITPAKMFEIMASGAMLFTNESDYYGLKHLFPDDCYMTYKEDFTDLEVKATLIVNDIERTKEIAKRGRQCILDRHTDAIRTQQLMEILRSL